MHIPLPTGESGPTRLHLRMRPSRRLRSEGSERRHRASARAHGCRRPMGQRHQARPCSSGSKRGEGRTRTGATKPARACLGQNAEGRTRTVATTATHACLGQNGEGRTRTLATTSRRTRLGQKERRRRAVPPDSERPASFRTNGRPGAWWGIPNRQPDRPSRKAFHVACRAASAARRSTKPAGLPHPDHLPHSLPCCLTRQSVQAHRDRPPGLTSTLRAPSRLVSVSCDERRWRHFGLSQVRDVGWRPNSH